MAIPVIMPQVGYDINEAKILEWKTRPGDEVRKGQVIAIVESEKASFEVEAPADGTVARILFDAGAIVPVLKPIAFIGGQENDKVILENEQLVETTAVRATPPESPTNSSAAGEVRKAASDRIIATPMARVLAKEKGIDLSCVRGSGPGGRIVERDIRALAAEPPSVPLAAAHGDYSADVEIPFTRMREAIARRMVLSAQTIPAFYLFCDVNVSEIAAWREDYNRRHGTHITITDIIIKATALALTQYRRLNAHVLEGRIVEKANINIGVAVSVSDGLLVPVIPNADWKDLAEINRLTRKIADDARRNVVDSRVPGTFTVSNLGATAVDRFLPIINPPECAILGVAGIRKQVVPIRNGIGIIDVVTLTLGADHRAVDGAYGAKFLETLKKNLEAYHIES